MILYITNDEISLERQNKIKFWLNNSKIVVKRKSDSLEDVKPEGLTSVIFDYENDDAILKRIQTKLSCSIIAKVKNDEQGIKVIRNNEDVEYFIDSDDDVVLSYDMKNAFRLATIAHRINNNYSKAKSQVGILQKCLG